MKPIVLTQGYYAFVDDRDYDWLNQFKWYYDGGYARRGIKNGCYKTTITMHKEIFSKYNPMYFGEPDHIDTNGLNNQLNNLRQATDLQQNANRKKLANSKSTYKGVSRERGKFKARIKKDGIEQFLGYFKEEIEAAKAYDRAAIRLFGEYANLNFPK